jgi:predicted nicotinamide N-methyase
MPLSLTECSRVHPEDYTRTAQSESGSRMTAYSTKQESIAVVGVNNLEIRSLLNREQYSDPFGLAARLGISSGTWPLFGLLWPSGTHLAARIAKRAVQANETILEVGCGLALASLVGHRRGANVTASDVHPLAEVFLQENLRLNGLPPLKYRNGSWVDQEIVRLPGEPLRLKVEGRFNLIIGSDLLYDRNATVALAGFIGRHACENCEVWIADPERGNRPAFNLLMAAQGYSRDEERLDTFVTPIAAAYKGRMLIYRRCQ